MSVNWPLYANLFSDCRSAFVSGSVPYLWMWCCVCGCRSVDVDCGLGDILSKFDTGALVCPLVGSPCWFWISGSVSVVLDPPVSG